MDGSSAGANEEACGECFSRVFAQKAKTVPHALAFGAYSQDRSSDRSTSICAKWPEEEDRPLFVVRPHLDRVFAAKQHIPALSSSDTRL